MKNGKFNILEVFGLTLLTVAAIVCFVWCLAVLTRGW